MRVKTVEILSLAILISVLAFYTVQTLAARHHVLPGHPTPKPVHFAHHDGNHHDVHPMIELEEGVNLPHVDDQHRKLPARHAHKKRTYKVVYFDSEGDSIHQSSEENENPADVQIDPENRASKEQSKSDAASSSEQAPEIENTVAVPELVENAEKWGFHSKEQQ